MDDENTTLDDDEIASTGDSGSTPAADDADGDDTDTTDGDGADGDADDSDADDSDSNDA
jgi:hypothetical protein